MPTPFSYIDTSGYADAYVGQSIARNMAMYDPQAGNTAAERLATLGFYGKTGAGVEHAVAKIQTHAVDSSRKAALQFLLNAGDADDKEFAAMKVDANGAFKVQMFDSVANAAVANVNLSAAGVMDVRATVNAPLVEAATQLKGPHFDAIGQTVTVGPAATQFKVDAADKSVKVSDGASNTFLYDLNLGKTSSTMDAQFDKNMIIGSGAAMSAQFEVNDGQFKLQSKANSAQVFQFVADNGTPGLLVSAPVSGSKYQKLVMESGKSQMIESLTSKGLTVDHGASTVNVDYAITLQQALTVQGAAVFNNAVDVGQSLAPQNLVVWGNEVVHGTLNVNGAATFAAAVTLGSDLNVEGNASIDGTMHAAGAATFDSSVTVAGDTTINGNLVVNGIMTTIESTTVTVADKTIELSKIDTPTLSTALNSGFEVSYPGGNKTFLYAESAGDLAAFSANVGLNVPSAYAYQINGEKVMTKDYVDLPEASGAYKIDGVSLLTKSELVLQKNVSDEANMQLGAWRLSQSGDNLYIQKYDGTAWVNKAQFK